MSDRKSLAFTVFHFTLGIVVFILSAETVLYAVRKETVELHKMLLALLAGMEALAALLFLFKPTLKTGGYLLMIIFGFAFCFHGLQGEFELPLLIYLAGVFLVVEYKR